MDKRGYGQEGDTGSWARGDSGLVHGQEGDTGLVHGQEGDTGLVHGQEWVLG